MTPSDAYAQSHREYLAKRGILGSTRYLKFPRTGERAHLLEVGKGPPLLLLHGAGFMGASFDPLLHSLSQEFRLLAPDRPGCGLSPTSPSASENFRCASVSFVDDLFDALELEDAVIVGASLGGYLGLMYALKNPDRVRRLILLGPPPGIEVSVPFPVRLLCTPVVNQLLAATVAKPTVSGTRQMFATAMVEDIDKVPPEYLTLLSQAQLLPGAQVAWLKTLRSLSSPWGIRQECLLFDDLPQLSVPVSMIWGEKDKVTPPSRGREVMETIPEFDLHVLARTGHLVWLDSPERTADLMRSFLS